MKHSHHHPAPKRGSKKDTKGKARQRSKADAMAAKNAQIREQRRGDSRIELELGNMAMAEAIALATAARRKRTEAKK